jgi:hypothetical protein
MRARAREVAWSGAGGFMLGFRTSLQLPFRLIKGFLILPPNFNETREVKAAPANHTQDAGS